MGVLSILGCVKQPVRGWTGKTNVLKIALCDYTWVNGFGPGTSETLSFDVISIAGTWQEEDLVRWITQMQHLGKTKARIGCYCL